MCQSAIEGWILFVSGIHEEADEDSIHDLFSEYGSIKNLRINLDRKTALFKGYALVEFDNFDDAKKAQEGLNGHEIFEKKLKIDWAFKKN